MPDDLTTRPVTGADTLRRGVRVLWRGIQDEPAMFALAVVGSAVYGAGTAGAGWLLGHLTQTVLTPAFAAGHVTGAQLAYAVGSLALVALLTSVGVATRRAAAGAVMFRLQARYRRAVARQYLRLPLAWHHRHPPGQLLSNANADVEAIWQVFAPLPMAIGVVVMLVVAAAAMLAADPLLGAVWLARPACRVRRERRLPADHVAARRPRSATAGQCLGGGPRELRGRCGRQDPRAGGGGDVAVRRRRRRAAGRQRGC